MISTFNDASTSVALTPAAADLLGLLAKKPIPASYCDLRPKNELVRFGFAERIAEIQNTLRNPTGATFKRLMLYATHNGRQWLVENANADE